MILIAHRGNTSGKNLEKENTTDYINMAIFSGYDVEIDLWVVYGSLFLGHDYPQQQIDKDYLNERAASLWVHCKNSDAFDTALDMQLNCFVHDTDDYTMTNRGFVWAYPGKPAVYNNTICVMPESVGNIDITKYAGVCSDRVVDYLNV